MAEHKYAEAVVGLFRDLGIETAKLLGLAQ